MGIDKFFLCGIMCVGGGAMSKMLTARVYFYDGTYMDKPISKVKEVQNIPITADTVKIVVFDKVCEMAKKGDMVKRYYIGVQISRDIVKKLFKGDTQFLKFVKSLDANTKFVLGKNYSISALCADDKVIPLNEIVAGYWCPKQAERKTPNLDRESL